MNPDITTERGPHLWTLARRSQENLLRGVDFLLHQAGRLASLPQTITREHPDFKKKALWLTAGAGIIGVISFLTVRDYMVGQDLSRLVQISDASQTSQSTSTSEQSTFTQDVTENERVLSPFEAGEIIANYIREYLKEDKGSLLKRDRDLSMIIASNLVGMKVTDPMGIIVRDFPDIRPERSRRMPTKGSATDPFIKAWYFDQDIPGLFTLFIYERDPQTHQLINIWAARLSNEGGWSIHKQPHSEFFRVGGLEQTGWKWYTSFETEDGLISGERLFGDPFKLKTVYTQGVLQLV